MSTLYSKIDLTSCFKRFFLIQSKSNYEPTFSWKYILAKETKKDIYILTLYTN